MHMDLASVDLNLLRLFDAVYRHGSVSRAAEQLNLTQPAASQGVRRLRTLLQDPLFTRSARGVQPTPRADRLADPVRRALATLELALSESDAFDPTRSSRTFHLHMSDIGESRFLPPLMAALRRCAPGVRVEARPWPREELSAALHAGRVDLAFGFLPMLADTQHARLLEDRYVILLRADHPFLAKPRSGRALLSALDTLEFVAVRSHADTRRILELLQIEGRLRLVTEHFMVLPAIVRATDLVALVPLDIARGFGEGLAIVQPPFPLREFTVSLHWSRRYEVDPGHRWLRGVVQEIFSSR